MLHGQRRGFEAFAIGVFYGDVLGGTMNESWTQRADKILSLLSKLPVVTQGSDEKVFRTKVWELCIALKDAEACADGGQLVPPPLL